MAFQNNVKITQLSRNKFKNISDDLNTQGIIAIKSTFRYTSGFTQGASFAFLCEILPFDKPLTLAISDVDFPLSIREATMSTAGTAATSELAADLPLEEVEKVTILKTLEFTGGNKSEAARRLGITRRTLHKKLKKYGVM